MGFKGIVNFMHLKLGATIWLPALTGFGTKPEDLLSVTFDMWMNDAQEGLDRLQTTCDTIIVLGHSFGGLLGLLLAAENESISTLISWAGTYKIKDRRLGFLPFVYKIPLIRRLIPKKFPMNPPEALIQQGWIRYSWMPRPIVFSLIEGLKHLYKSISEVNCPIFVIQGSLDESITEDSPHKIYQLVNSSKKDIWIIEGGHHPLMQDKHLKDELFEKTVQFIRSANDLQMV